MTPKEISAYAKISRSTITRMAKKGGWEFTAKRCRGGHTYDYNILKLPADIRSRIKASEIIRDKTIAWIDRLTESPWFDRACWAVMGMAAMYFGPTCLRLLAR